jgi:hypothetical protein
LVFEILHIFNVGTPYTWTDTIRQFNLFFYDSKPNPSVLRQGPLVLVTASLLITPSSLVTASLLVSCSPTHSFAAARSLGVCGLRSTPVFFQHARKLAQNLLDSDSDLIETSRHAAPSPLTTSPVTIENLPDRDFRTGSQQEAANSSQRLQCVLM